MTYSSDSGDTWTKPIEVNDNATPACAVQPWATVDSRGRGHVAWTDTRDGKNDAYYAGSANPSQGFEQNGKVNDASGNVVVDVTMPRAGRNAPARTALASRAVLI